MSKEYPQLAKFEPPTLEMTRIRETIPDNSIREQRKNENLIEIAGLVTVNDLPFVWRARSDALGNQDFHILAPVKPDCFGFGKFMKSMEPDDMRHILETLRISPEAVDQAVNVRTNPDLYNHLLAVYDNEYQMFYRKYLKDQSMQQTFCGAVSMYCREKVADTGKPANNEQHTH